MAKKPVRIAQVIGKVVLGGVDAVVMNYYRNIDRSKFQFDFFMDGLEPTPIDAEISALGGRIFKLPTYEDSMSANLSAFRQILKENNYPILHCHMNTLSVFWLREAKKAGVPIRIAHSHSTAAKGESKRNILKYALRPMAKLYPNAYCTCSHYAGRWLFGNRFYAKGKVQLVRNAVDLSTFAYSEQARMEVRRELGLENAFVMGHIGRFMTQKNHSYLLEIFKALSEKRKDAVLLLVGDGPLRAEMEQKAEQLGISDKTVFLGIRRDVPRLLQAMDAFVLPSLYEGLPVVGVEAQAAGLPCFFSTGITTEVMLGGPCQMLHITMPPAVWAGEIAKISPSGRATPTKSLMELGYNIQEEAEELQVYYSSQLQMKKGSFQ